MVKELVVKVNGRVIATEVMSRLVEIKVLQKLSLPTLCELVFLADTDAGDAKLAKLGGEIEVRVKLASSAELLFAGEVTARNFTYSPAEGAQLRIRAYDKLHRMRKQQKVGVRVKMSLKDLAAKLVKEAGVGLAVKSSCGTGPTWERMIQGDESHLDFLRAKAGGAGCYFTLREKAVHLGDLKGFGKDGSLVLGENLIEATLEVNGDHSARTVSVEAWNPRLAGVMKGKAGRARSGRKVRAEAAPSKVGGASTWEVSGQVCEDATQAVATAQAELDQRTADEVVFRGMSAGDPKLAPLIPVKVSGVAAEVEGRYVLTEVTHEISPDRGYLCHLSSEPPKQEERGGSSMMALGKVTRVNDPEGFGRVQVSLQGYRDAETDWMQVVHPGAGKKKGFVVPPAVGDMVLVLCAREDPAQGVVMGGLFGSEKPVDDGVDGAKTERFTIVTPGGHRLTFDDKKNSLKVEGSKGSYLEFGPGKVLLHAAAALEIEAPGKPVVVKGASIEFKKG